eukprot:9800807-Alexandrium_andersonii.AAC.1
MTCRESRLVLPRAERLRPAADAERLIAAASPPCQPASLATPADADSPGTAGSGCLDEHPGERRPAPASPEGPSEVGAVVADGAAGGDAVDGELLSVAPAER